MTNTTSQDPTTFKDAITKALDEAAALHEIPRESVVAEIVVGLMTSVMIGHHARKGNVAKVLYWGFAGLNMNAANRARRLRVQLKKQHDG